MKVRPVTLSARHLTSQIGIGLGRLNALNPKMLLVLTFILFLTDIGYEGQRSPQVLPWLFLFSPASIVVFLLVFVGMYLLIRRISNDTFRALGVVFSTLLAAAAKSLTLMVLVHRDSFFTNFQERISGDLTIAGVYIVISAVMFHAYNNHLQVIEELNRVSKRLTEQKETTIEVASEVEAELQEKANAALGAELDRISTANEAVFDALETSSLKMQIQALVRNRVRPLSRELHARVQILRSKNAAELKLDTFRDVWKLRVITNIDADFIASYVIAMPNIFFTIASKAGLLNALLVLAISLSYPVLGRLIQFALPGKRMPISYVFNFPALASILAYAPTGVVLYLLGQEFPLVGVTALTAGGVLLFTCISSTAWFALQRTRDENADEILRINAEIRHELDLLDQAVWVAQRKWSYIIHGTVQGALTVAASRLEMAVRPDEALKTAVRADVERAKTVLVNPPTFDRPVRELFDEIRSTWQGVCDFEYQISPSAELALSKNQTSVTCLVEITKELISNANRHGGANKFWFNAYLNPDGDMSIVAGNNGKLVAVGAGAGLGFEMISRLTRNWSLVGGSSTSFSGTLPVPRG